MAPELAFSYIESCLANETWGANCGPHSLAAALGIGLEEARVLMPEFTSRPLRSRFTNPTMMGSALNRSGVRFTCIKNIKSQELTDGISRVQFVGEWLNPDRHPAEAYRHTHWVAHFRGFVLCTAVNPFAWVTKEDWKRELQAEGHSWYITHWYFLGVAPKKSFGNQLPHSDAHLDS